MRPMIASMSEEENIQNASNIYKAAILCMFLSTLREYKSGALL